MAMLWNTSSITGNIGTDLVNLNTQLDSNVALLLAVIIFLVVFLLTRRANGSAGLTISAFITWIACLFMAMMGMMPGDWMIVPLIIFVISLFFAWREHNAYDV